MSCKIVFIGAGSVEFGSAIIGDLAYHAKDLVNAEIVLVDIDPNALGRALAYAQRLFAGLPLRVSATSDRRVALPGADFVIVSVAVNRIAEWKLDWSIPLKHGVRHVRGENGGPGALRHAMRSIPLVLAIARDIETQAPQALMLNYTNPLARVCLAVARHTAVRCVGLSRQISEGYRIVNQVLGLVPEREPMQEDADDRAATVKRSQLQQVLEECFHLEAGGINGFSFVTRMTDLRSGENLYPKFHHTLIGMPDNWQLLSRRLYDAFGLFCAGSEAHAGEFVGWAADVLPLRGVDFDAYISRAVGVAVDLEAVVNGTIPPQRALSGERAVPIIVAVVNNRMQQELSVNILNRGHVASLPEGSIVEVPGVVDGAGVRGLPMADLPEGLASLMRNQCDISSLVVACVCANGYDDLWVQPLLLDPTVRSFMQARHLLSDFECQARVRAKV